MGLFKKKSSEPVEYNLWDGKDKPTEWFFSDAGKAAFESAFANVEEMSQALNDGHWYSIVSDVCLPKTLKVKKNWPLKFFHEYMKSCNGPSVIEVHTLVLITAMATVRDENTNELCFPYPDCLDAEKNPIFYYYSHVKDILRNQYSEIRFKILINIVHYIYSVYLEHDKDASKESWMYDKSFYFDYSGEPKDSELLLEQLENLVEFPDCLN